MKFHCPRCTRHLEAEDDMEGMLIDCPSCKGRIEIPCSVKQNVEARPCPPVVITTPEPALRQGVSAHMGDASDAPVERPGTLVALIILSCVHIVVNVFIFCVGAANGNGAAIGGGLVSAGFYIAILIGLIKMQEWARIMLIWLAYCGIVFSLGIFAPLEIPTLILAHWPSVRKATKGASIPKAYTYHEHQEQKGEEAR
jgi:DNA-directed RNA polymerase subunit RPC12/RpoP